MKRPRIGSDGEAGHDRIAGNIALDDSDDPATMPDGNVEAAITPSLAHDVARAIGNRLLESQEDDVEDVLDTPVAFQFAGCGSSLALRQESESVDHSPLVGDEDHCRLHVRALRPRILDEPQNPRITAWRGPIDCPSPLVFTDFSLSIVMTPT